MAGKRDDDRFPDEEAKRRFEATLRGALKTPPMHARTAPLPAKRGPKPGARKPAKPSS